MDALDILKSAITDVGYWSWWDTRFFDVFQIEFGGVQLRGLPQKDGEPPPGQVALRFSEPESVSFLTRRADAGSKRSARPADLPQDWPDRLHKDAIKPFGLASDDLFGFDASAVEAAVAGAERIDTVLGPPPLEVLAPAAPQAMLAFWAGSAGIAILAASMQVLTHGGEMPLEQIPAAHERWWEYWREYWRRRGSANPLPRDYACEATIPAH
jgi:hypothetical protein